MTTIRGRFRGPSPVVLALALVACGAPDARAPEPYWAADDRACDGGSLEACLNVARANEDIFDDRAMQVRHHAYERACKLGNATTCRYVGESLLEKNDVARGLPLVERACELGDSVACINASVGLKFGSMHFPKDPERARHVGELACKGGDTQTCEQEMYASSDDPARIAKLEKALLCRAPTDPCEEFVGQALAKRANVGLGWSDDAPAAVARGKAMLAAAREQFEIACTKKQPYGCINLGLVLFDPSGGPVDATRAAQVLDEPCTSTGDDAACFARGRALLALHDDAGADAAFRRPCRDAPSTRCDVERGRALAATGRSDAALAIFERACRSGDASTCVAAGKILFAKKNAAAAAADFGKACDAGVASGCTRLAALYAAGRGVPKNLAKAKALLDRACGAGDVDACPVAHDDASLLALARDLGSAIADGVWDLTKKSGRFLLQLFFVWPLEGTIKVLDAIVR